MFVRQKYLPLLTDNQLQASFIIPTFKPAAGWDVGLVRCGTARLITPPSFLSFRLFDRLVYTYTLEKDEMGCCHALRVVVSVSISSVWINQGSDVATRPTQVTNCIGIHLGVVA